jgi:hypothetical protein
MGCDLSILPYGLRITCFVWKKVGVNVAKTFRSLLVGTARTYKGRMGNRRSANEAGQRMEDAAGPGSGNERKQSFATSLAVERSLNDLSLYRETPPDFSRLTLSLDGQTHSLTHSVPVS